MKESKEYFAFISYKSEDVEWAIWLQHELEQYRLPSSFNGRTDVRQELRPVFRDIDELSAGNLPEQILQALINSQNLIVICSPQAAKSSWVNKEVEIFISLGRTNQIFPFIIDGDLPKDFFPPALVSLPKSEERLGGNVRKNGKDVAFVKVVAGMLHLGFDSLWNRYEKEKIEKEKREREAKNKLLRMQSRFVAEKASNLIDPGSYLAKLLALEILPNDLQNPNRPYTPEAEALLRRCFATPYSLLLCDKDVSFAKYSPNGKNVIGALALHTYVVWNIVNSQILDLNLQESAATYVTYSSDGKRIASTNISNGDIYIWDAQTNELLQLIQTGEDSISFLEYFNNDKELIFATVRSEIFLWDIEQNKILRRIGFYSKFPHKSDISISRGLYCNTDNNGNILVKDIKSDVIVWKKESNNNKPFYIGYVSISPDGELIGYTTVKDLYVWNLSTNTILLKYDITEMSVVSFKFNNRHDAIAIAYSKKDNKNKGIEILSINLQKIIACFEEDITTETIIEFSKDDRSIMICNPGSPIKIYNCTSNNRQILNIKSNSSLERYAFNYSKTLLATADIDGNIIIWDVVNRCKVSSFSTNLHDIYDIYIGSDNHIVIISGSLIGENAKYLLETINYDENINWFVSVWSMDGQLANIIEEYDSFILGAQFVKNEETMCAYSNNIQLWRNSNNILVKIWESKDLNISEIKVDSRGRMIAALNNDTKSFIIYDTITKCILGEIICGIEQHEYITCFAFSPDCNYLALGTDCGIVQVWDLNAYNLINSWKVYRYSVSSIAFSKDEKTLFTVTDKFESWNIETATLIHVLDNIELMDSKKECILLNERDLLLITSSNLRFYVYPPLQELINTTQEGLVNVGLTSLERRLYYLE